MKQAKSNVGLICFMGTGKTTVGKALAEALGFAFVDADTIIEERQGAAIPEIFAKQGEGFFRALESTVLKDLAAGTKQVIAVGGGAVLRPDNFAALDAGCCVVCLKAAPHTILRRIGQDTGRPLLAGADRLGRITSLLADRAVCYDKARHFVDTDDKTVPAIVDEIQAILRAAGFAALGESH